ncbi:transcriptional regulator, AlpA family [Pseudomonas anguilliseptica]|uniref:Transcriptional regulator, AlpA family n=1 Tax=Pseudomonas anguilliseptica TaxID=53406 RepID=A0A1H5CNP9_PSEAG|nr:transcriptional regulator, AlpA family [Pseudomonas anguilliseptica]
MPDFTSPVPIQMMSFTAACDLLCRSRSGLYKLMRNDLTFPVPIKDSDARTARAFFVAAEIAAWQNAQLASRSAASEWVE